MSEQLDLLITESVERKRMPTEPIVRSADIEDCYRWTLRRAWGSGPCILWCGLNPSTADGKRDDPTMLREIGFSYRWGFGSLVKVNIFPFITSSPAKLDEWLKAAILSITINQAIIRNWREVTKTITEISVDGKQTCVAAWGSGCDKSIVDRFLSKVGLLVDTSEHDGFGWVSVPVDWHCLGTNDDGSPRHTLARGKNRIPDDAKLKLWRKSES